MIYVSTQMEILKRLSCVIPHQAISSVLDVMF